MAHRRSSIKKIRIDRKRTARNRSVLTALRTQMRKTNRLIGQKNAAEARKECRELFSQLDKAVKKHLLHQNSASRQKSRFTLRINSITVNSPK